MFIGLTIFIVSVSAGCSLTEYGVYTIDQAFECITSVTVDEQYRKNITKFMRAYIGTICFQCDILKAPPKVNGHEIIIQQ